MVFYYFLSKYFTLDLVVFWRLVCKILPDPLNSFYIFQGQDPLILGERGRKKGEKNIPNVKQHQSVLALTFLVIYLSRNIFFSNLIQKKDESHFFCRIALFHRHRNRLSQLVKRIK